MTKINDNTKLIKMPALKWGNKLEKLTAYIWSRSTPSLAIIMFMRLVVTYYEINIFHEFF